MLASLLQRPADGMPLTVHAFRRDELKTFRMELDAAPLDTAYLELTPEPVAATASRREAWLGTSG